MCIEIKTFCLRKFRFFVHSQWRFLLMKNWKTKIRKYWQAKISLPWWDLRECIVRLTLGVATFRSSNRNESRILSCSADLITVVDVVVVGGINVDGDHTLPDSIFSNVGIIRLNDVQTLFSLLFHIGKFNLKFSVFCVLRWNYLSASSSCAKSDGGVK